MSEILRLAKIGAAREAEILAWKQRKEEFDRSLREAYENLAAERAGQERTCRSCWPDDYGHELHCQAGIEDLVAERNTLRSILLLLLIKW